jgi:type VI secretion system protein ImpE
VSLEIAERLVREGDLDGGLRALQQEIRREPSNADLRVFLFQLYSVIGQWDRALTQLNIASDLAPKALGMAQVYRAALHCEALRAAVFAGERSPVVFGDPEEWLALLIESMIVAGTSRAAEASSLRERAFESAPTSSGSIDGGAFAWIADADMRLGPVCEAIINGRYYWVPFSRFSRVVIEAPADLRDFVWTPAEFHFANGGEAVGLIPTRYPGSEASSDCQIRLARKTVWEERAPGMFHGLGQRVLTTDAGDRALMDVRTLLVGERRE